MTADTKAKDEAAPPETSAPPPPTSSDAVLEAESTRIDANLAEIVADAEVMAKDAEVVAKDAEVVAKDAETVATGTETVPNSAESAPIADEPAKEPEPEPEPAEVAAPPPIAPSIASVKPDHGPLTGGATIVVTGAGFAEGCEVSIDGVSAKTERTSEGDLSVVTPPRAQKGFAELRVVNPDGQLAIYEEDYRYDPAPVVTGVTPAHAREEGGDVITILGADFAEGAGVRIGGELVPCSFAGAGRLEAVTKRHALGEADVCVENPDGQRAVRERALRFAAPPRIDTLDPESSPTSGGVEITVRGGGFEGGLAVLVAGEPVPSARFVSEGELVFVAPARASADRCDVGVVNPTGLADRRALALSYVKSPPRVASVSPVRGPSAGGTEIVVRGERFDASARAYLCGVEAKIVASSAEELRLLTPAVARDGDADLRVVNADEQADVLAHAFFYVAALPPPRLATVSPASGSQLGGLAVAVLGEDFADGVIVSFGGVVAATRFLTHRELAVTAPAFAGSGEVTVAVENPDGARSELIDGFTYEARPVPEITSVSPAFGPTSGGTRVVIEGANFSKDAAVFVGREVPKDVASRTANAITIVTPPRKQAGVVDVEVAVAGAGRGVMKNAFRYDASPAPLITSVSPNAGTPGGGTEMTVTGKNFTKETAVLVDGKAPRAVKLVDASTLEFRTPPGEAGKLADVVVRSPDGKEAVQKRAFLYDPRYRG
jgi:hypothetical protein